MTWEEVGVGVDVSDGTVDGRTDPRPGPGVFGVTVGQDHSQSDVGLESVLKVGSSGDTAEFTVRRYSGRNRKWAQGKQEEDVEEEKEGEGGGFVKCHGLSSKPPLNYLRAFTQAGPLHPSLDLCPH